jgi:hypothetical protein
MFRHHHPDPPAKEKAKKQDLYYEPMATSLQGTKILGIREFNLEEYIALFIQRRLVDRSFSWAKRENPYEGR